MPSYTEEFKKEAVRLIQEEGMTIAQVKKLLVSAIMRFANGLMNHKIQDQTPSYQTMRKKS